LECLTLYGEEEQKIFGWDTDEWVECCHVVGFSEMKRTTAGIFLLKTGRGFMMGKTGRARSDLDIQLTRPIMEVVSLA
jgi:hypothetical protein